MGHWQSCDMGAHGSKDEEFMPAPSVSGGDDDKQLSEPTEALVESLMSKQANILDIFGSR